MVAGITLPSKRIKCPSCGKYKTAEHLEDKYNGYCNNCGALWGRKLKNINQK